MAGVKRGATWLLFSSKLGTCVDTWRERYGWFRKLWKAAERVEDGVWRVESCGY